FAQSGSERIQLNQVGFYPQAKKVAVVTGNTTATSFYIVRTEIKDTVYKGTLGAEKQSLNSATVTRLADFSKVQQAGSFQLIVPEVGQSYVFQIGKHMLRPVALAALKGFYFMRSDQPLDAAFAGKWSRAAGHPDTTVFIHESAADAKRSTGTKIKSAGGWYDAGDYNKYIVNSGITMGTLLSAYEDFKPYFDTLHCAIPESGNKVPDILDETLYNLRWMLTMQDSNDGGVYHKCTNAAFDGMVMPGVTQLPRYAVQKSTAAALDFAAVCAQASRVFSQYKNVFPGLADSCKNASEKAWQWALQHPSVIYDQETLNKRFDPDISTGAYGDRNVSDEWLWAAAELFITTKSKQYFDTISNHLQDSVRLPSWSDVALLSHYSLLRYRTHLPAYAQPVMGLLKSRVLRLADVYIDKISSNAFATVMGGSPKDFVWGSSAVAAYQGVLLLNAYQLTRYKKYLDAALTNLDYLLGRNATGYCFLTGSGSKSPMHPHHRPSVADGVVEPVPGLLSGGPNPGQQDHCVYLFSEPETSFSDTDCSYASNEIAINWNAPMVYLAHAIEALSGTFTTK
ncbi:MAG TPA: glycoside hydrolase family 9 protein, partial [Chitinophagaceae bacterium]|nr:glycoside hydrolase family 9 protein [Chitinophagaceae bacterium]